MTDYNNETPTGKRTGLILGGVVAVAVVGAAALYLIDVDQTQEARLPDVDVQVEQGQLPEFDVDVAEVSIGEKDVVVEVPTMDVETKTIEVEVPVDVDADMTTETLSVPTIDIERPEKDDPADNPAN